MCIRDRYSAVDGFFSLSTIFEPTASAQTSNGEAEETQPEMRTIYDGTTTYVSLRDFVIRHCPDASFSYNGKKACVSFSGRYMEFPIGAIYYYVDGRILPISSPCFEKDATVYAVSYTHLDVYKRQVPLVIPEINPADAFRHNGIIANPNCSTIIALMALYPIAAISPIKTIVASTYQAVSGAGIGGIAELESQTKAIAQGGEIETKVFAYQIAQHLIPQIGGFNENGYTSEEMQMQNEGRKIRCV